MKAVLNEMATPQVIWDALPMGRWSVPGEARYILAFRWTRGWKTGGEVVRQACP